MAGKPSAVEDSDSVLLFKGPCDECGSSDANAHYSDGHKHCFSCSHHEKGDGDVDTAFVPRKRAQGLIDVDVRGLRARGITDETCRRFGYGFGQYKGKLHQVAPYYDREGNLVAQHLRDKNKNFPWLGEPKKALPFGAHAWNKTGRRIVVTEGEVDALAMSQVQGNKWPVVSIGCGADRPFNKDGEPMPMSGIRRYIARQLDYFNGFDVVVIMFDNDEQGRASAEVAAEVLGSRAHIATLPPDIHDAADGLKQGRTAELIDSMWKAKRHTPTGMHELMDLQTVATSEQAPGVPYPWPSLTKMVRGYKRGELIVVCGAQGAGKTDLLFEIMAAELTERKEPVGVFFLEDPPGDVAVRIAAKLVKSPLYSLDEPLLNEAAFEKMQSMGLPPMYVYDSAGSAEWEDIKERIKYLANAEGVKAIVVDHVTAIAAEMDDERRSLDVLMKDIAGLAQELDITIFLVSHLTTPEKGSHEEGARIMSKHLRGSRSIHFWPHSIIALERNQQAETESERSRTFVRILKNRRYSRAVGQGVWMQYNFDTGMLEECEAPHLETDEAEAFQDTPADF